MLRALKKQIPQNLKNIYHLLEAFIAVTIYRYPARSLKVIGVTGTDGKTTTVNLIYHILKESGYSVGMISTIGAVSGSEVIDTGFHVTTPSPFAIQKFLRTLVDQKVQYAILEVTSHALDQNRVVFIPFYAGVITNVTHEHLDYHKTYSNYLLTKAKLLGNVKYRVLNEEDKSFEKLKMMGSGQLITFGKIDSNFFGEEIASLENATHYALHYKTKQKQLKTLGVLSKLKGDFNLSNILAAFAVSKLLGVDDKKLASSISNFVGVEGRIQEVNQGQDFRVIVDFAHTPNALESVLNLLRKETTGSLIAVFGAAGERDKRKRSIMGQIASRIADLIIVTSEDPREEDPRKIIEDISRGIMREGGVHNKSFWKVVNRAEAIEFAVKNLADKGDCVVVLGKGHEKSMNYAGKEIPWSDKLAVELALKRRLQL